jgi:serine/threonine protein kinase
MTDLTEALDYLHRLDVLHGDVQSDNVYRMKDGTVKLGGFGDPCQVPRKAGERFTVTGGCRLYAPPEWRDSVSPHRPLQSHERPLASYDMWGLGCILSELVTLEPIGARVALGDSLAGDPAAFRAVKESLTTAHGGLFAALGLSLLQPVPEQRMEADAALRVLSRVRDHCAPLSSRQRRVFAHLYPNLEWANTGA